MTYLATGVAIFMAFMAFFIRMKAAKKPATIKKIILPPMFMSTGFFMFLYEPVRISSLQVLEALAVGLLFSIFLVKTSKFEIRDEHIYFKKSKSFLFILLGLLVIRLVLKYILGFHIDPLHLSGMFFIVAYGMIVPWRISMFLGFKKLQKKLAENQKLNHIAIDPVTAQK
ncbi:cytochrome c biogenesis protein CcdC [Anaerobacillus alkaliphilus]|uniref:Cytochrome c biogenesis protein CcdC n=1 Tax=Anaerobacillus alkaliphilus TaxID=1548597 RepID=A0A4V1LFY7_9BACI|nr:cytochrome c biogenesis protein CcdC [Anaerobacillus alkaliphilus]RXI97904.1 cytochrome c biogenesis protein CcdC [Anaerobacillus alkaliphilus]